MLEYPAAMAAMQVQAADYSNLALHVYQNGTIVYDGLLSSAAEFVPTFSDTCETIEFELNGTSRVRRLQAAEDMGELT